jgi:hypothetical protein
MWTKYSVIILGKLQVDNLDLIDLIDELLGI